MAGPEQGQICELIVDVGLASERRGSGYRVGAHAVLTAAHVVAAARTTTVRFDADRPGEWSRAATVAFADEPAKRAADLAAVSGALCATGRENEARAVLTDAIAAVAFNPPSLNAVVSAMIRAHMIAEAEAAIYAIEDHRQRDSLLDDLAAGLAGGGQVDAAERLFRALPPEKRLLSPTAVVLALAEAGRIDEARRLALQLDGEDDMYGELAGWLVRSDRLAEAEEFLDALGDTVSRLWATVEVVGALAESHRFAEAERLALSADEDAGTSIRVFVGELLAAGRYEDAARIARGMLMSDQYGDGVRVLADVQVRLGTPGWHADFVALRSR